MSKSYIRKRYEYMMVTTPAAMGGMFFLSMAGYSYGLVQPQTLIAGPMIGGSLSLFGWFLYEIQNLFNVKKPSFKYESNQPFFILNQKQENYDFVFRGRNLKIELPKDRLEKFCKIGIKRQEQFFDRDDQTLYAPHYKKLSKNTVWAERVFLERNFLSEEVWTAKYILWSTGLFIEWNPNNQGKAGLSISTDMNQLMNKSQRRWKN